MNNLIWLALDKIIRLILGLFVGLWLARYLGPSKFGEYNYILSLTILCMPFITLGMDSILVNEIAKNKNRVRYILSAQIIRLISVLLIGTLLVFIKILFNLNYITISIIWLTLFFNSLYTADFYYQAINQANIFAKYSLISLFISSGLKIIGIYLNQGLTYFLFLYSTEFLIIATLLNFRFYYFYKLIFIKYNKKKFFLDSKILISKSWPLMLSALSVILYMKLDIIMLKYFSNLKEIGDYSAASRISELWYFIPMIIMTVYFPKLITLYNSKNIEKFESNLIFFYSCFLWGTIILSFIVAINSKFIVILLYGKDYEGASGILTIHMWTSTFVFLGVVSSKWAVIKGKQKFILYRTLIGLLSNIILNYFLINKYGAIGAAIATLISQFISSVFSNFLIPSLRESFYHQIRSIYFPFTYYLNRSKLEN